MTRKRIHIDNYEAFLLDRMEGSLPADLEKELDAFLAAHPYLAEDLDDLQDLSFVAESIPFDHKQSLKKSERDLVNDATLVAYIENQLNPEEKQAVDRSLASHPALQAEFELYRKTILQPDLTIVYEHKAGLKRKPKVIWLNRDVVRYAAAAVLLLFLGLIFLWSRKPVEQGSSLAGKRNAPVVKPPEKERSPVLPLDAATPDAPQVASNQPGDRNHEDQHGGSQDRHRVEAPANVKKDVLPQNNDNPVVTNTPVNHNEPVIHDEPIVTPANNKKEEPVVASSEPEPVHSSGVVTITEDDDNDAVPAKKKSGLWAMASRTLKSLHKTGVKSVDGNEQDHKVSTNYSLTFGGFQVTHSQTVD